MASSNQNLLEILKGKPRSQLPNIRHLAVSRLEDSDFPKGSSSNWKDRGSFHIEEKDTRRPDFILVRECLRVWICSRRALDRDGYPLYVELSFPDGRDQDPKDFARRFFSEVAQPDSIINTVLEKINTWTLRPVYIPADFAHPRGWFFHQLLGRKEHRKALAIAFFGIRNPVHCRHCIRSFLGTTSWNKEHILYPFPVCISIKGFMDGKCANCVWHSQLCEWEFLSGYQPKTATEGIQDWPLQGKDCPPRLPSVYGVDELNQQSCPRITHEFPPQPHSQAAGNVALKEGMRVADAERKKKFWDI